MLAHVLDSTPEVAGRIVAVHFGWNSRTTQEGRIVQRGDKFDIRINFTTKNDQSRLISPTPRWLVPVRACGGIEHPDQMVVDWPPGTAKRYATFLLLHELAHVVYLGRTTASSFRNLRGSLSEESFCDKWALQALRRVPLD